MKKRNVFKEIMLRLLHSKFFVIGGIIILILITLSIISPYIIVHDPEKADLAKRLLQPEWFSNGWSGNILGTDPLGQDILTRLLIGSRISFSVAFISVSASAAIGVILGIVAAYYGGLKDNIIMRLSDVQLSIPSMMLAVAVVAVLGTDLRNLILVLIITSWVQYARVVRSNVLIIRKMEFISASRALGASDTWIMFRQIFPNILTPLLILISQQLGFMILMEAGLSFLGLGVPPPTPSWGTMIADGRAYITTSPWVVLVPGIALMITVLGFNFLGDGLRDALDPKMRK
ncbi:MAG TPA: ABC transporter permease [Anaerovoracaceae bacterium]|nr:ABC transporter permease [Anaerovoracaceae bacterium]